MEADKLELHSDLYDTHIDVCTPDFLALCSDNFDWQDLRRDMIPGVLGQFEYLGKTIYTHVTRDRVRRARARSAHVRRRFARHHSALDLPACARRQPAARVHVPVRRALPL